MGLRFPHVAGEAARARWMLPGDEPEYLSPIEPRSLIRHARRRR